MATITILLEPSAIFSCALFAATYSPAGLAFSFSPSLLQWLDFLLAHLCANIPLLLSIIVCATMMYHHHVRLRALEQAPTSPSTTDFLRLLGVFRTTLRLLTIAQSSSQEALDDLRSDLLGLITQLGDDMTAVDTDVAAITTHINILRNCLAVLANNLDLARSILGADVPCDEDGLEMGDEVELFWDACEEDEDEGGDEMKEEGIDVHASDEMVEGWLEECEWPEECEDA
ncbi:hypothetical protein HBI56_054950 [Parastagonospora nodorum]|uniref:Uncharacterized protein n=2 Tax=Phaeosphaeria nodorum (strain SN15 / ATCC MYA-4574 / FGSC 10173) TaxID=321614 RepID=A0A7U2ICD8_PHANO|nr:hypothetical protein SNOG_12490 [Parastagonospora nodorum SN15]KAH3914008.1 hypothetical protein HBH56_097190 [Parastagonospora nodorum]EAT80303.2 hypothetical protein SNOG_12490 [Parastagonospora nodorum SN15]KAH3930445.1 hypothetical protein HBH54_111510 [Parastagonospora nodorum]KAH3944976.1 hypothetical protein HBH53_147920 [Parastagonospora nodorum]KAH3967062.1 hypothetical protein HBH51_139330 [Parastagonospora nodorum]